MLDEEYRFSRMELAGKCSRPKRVCSIPTKPEQNTPYRMMRSPTALMRQLDIAGKPQGWYGRTSFSNLYFKENSPLSKYLVREAPRDTRSVNEGRKS